MERQEINLEQWERAPILRFFNGFANPFIHITTRIECPGLKEAVKQKGDHFYWVYLHAILTASNEIEAMRYRLSIKDKNVLYLYDRIDALAVLIKDKNPEKVQIVKIPYIKDFGLFQEQSLLIASNKEIPSWEKEEKQGKATDILGQIMVSAMPFLDFTSLTSAQEHEMGSSFPLFTSGKITQKQGEAPSFAASLSAHHGLMDGYHFAQFFDKIGAYFKAYSE